MVSDANLNLADRESLIGSIPHGGIGAEIGVLTGAYSEVILRANEPSELWLIDCWECRPGQSGYEKEINDNYRRAYHQVLRMFAGDPRVFVIPDFSVKATRRFVDEYFDWVYIDADHADVAADLVAWVPKVKSGGWLLGHDYRDMPDSSQPNLVKRDVDAYAAEHGLELFLTEEESEIPSWAMRKPC